MNTINQTLLTAYCATRAWTVRSLHHIRSGESGQTSLEYIGLLVILGAALFVGAAALKGTNGNAGPLVGFMQEKIKAGFTAAMKALGIS